VMRRLRYHRLVVPVAWLAVVLIVAWAAAQGDMVGFSHLLILIALGGAAVLALLGRSRGDIGAVVRAQRDERQVSLDVRARSVVAAAVFVVCAVQGARWYLNGHSQLAQPYLLLGAVAVIAYFGSLVVLSRRH
jgi:hypothetical protein